MSEQMNNSHDQAVSMVKTQGILSIVFGAIGVLFGLIFMVIFAFAMIGTTVEDDAFGYFFLVVSTIVFWLIPHIYLIVSGSVLLKTPSITVVRVLTILNLIVGGFWNLVILIFSIITLTQLKDYELFSKK